MPPKKVYIERGLGSGRRIQKGYLRSVYDTLTSPENSGMVTAVTAFGVCPSLDAPPALHFLSRAITNVLAQFGVAFLASPLGELLLPP